MGQVTVRDQTTPISAAKAMRTGNKIVDGGHCIFDAKEKADFLASEPEAEKFLLPLVGSYEYINGGTRWILSLAGVSSDEYRHLSEVVDRIKLVREFRSQSKKAATRKLADYTSRANRRFAMCM